MKDSEITIVFEEPWFNDPFKTKTETIYEILKHTGWI